MQFAVTTTGQQTKDADPITAAIIGAAIAVHKALGPGLLESAYQACLEYELSERGVSFRSQLDVPVVYRGHAIGCGYRLDLLVEDQVIVEIKSVEALLPVHDAQLLTYLRLQNKTRGLLLNFNTPYLRDGIRRMVL
ncbi:MAG TPA: GxxExxY protein [Phycisphaerae bacterium]|nr:GxxExxY protein [Phycisphaerae bacterium]